MIDPPIPSRVVSPRRRWVARPAHSILNSSFLLPESFLICICYFCLDVFRSTPKKALRVFSEALLCRAKDALLNFNKARIACADHPLRIYEAVHVNRDPAVVHEHEVRVPDQPEMVRPESLDEELLRMPPKTEHFAMTRLELLFVHRRRLIHVRLARARTRPSLSPVYVRPVYVLSTTLNVRLSTHVCAGLRFCRLRFRLRLGLLLRGTHLLAFRRSCRLLLRRLLWLRLA